MDIIALCFGEKLDVLGDSSGERNECRDIGRMCIAVRIFSASTAWTLVTVLGSKRPDADIVGSVWKRGMVWPRNKERGESLSGERGARW